MKGKRHFLDVFFNPESLAVVGVSRDPSRMNFNLFANLVRLKFPGRVYPVNPNTEEILGIKAYPDLRSIKKKVDLERYEENLIKGERDISKTPIFGEGDRPRREQIPRAVKREVWRRDQARCVECGSNRNL